jgi:uracil-DNA glycosylase family 4
VAGPPDAGAGVSAMGPARDCPLCPRLVGFRQANREAEPSWHNAPVPSFGPLDAALLVVGLAPGRQGANRTGRPFTGDYAGDLLYRSLARFGFAEGHYQRHVGDGLRLIDARITNAVRCVPPQNKPTPAEVRQCREHYLAAEIAAMGRLSAILALGSIAHGAVLAAVGLRPAGFRFGHAAQHALPGDRLLVDSYHCSRLNTNTGRLTEAMFDAVVAELRRRVVLRDAP